MEQFTEDQIKDYRGTFDLFDHNGTGSISADSLGIVLRAHYLDLTDTRLQQIVDENSASEVDFDKFMKIAAQLLKEKSTMSPADMMDAFQKFDADNSGTVSVAMLRKVLGGMGEPPSEQDMDIFVQLAEGDDSGNIRYKELINKLYPQEEMDTTCICPGAEQCDNPASMSPDVVVIGQNIQTCGGHRIGRERDK